MQIESLQKQELKLLEYQGLYADKASELWRRGLGHDPSLRVTMLRHQNMIISEAFGHIIIFNLN